MTKTHWLRALELLREKLQDLENRGVRAFLIFFGITSILTIAKNARAMVDLIGKFFRLVRLPFHGLVGGATVAAVVLFAPNSGASADNLATATNRAEVPVVTTVLVPVEPLQTSNGRERSAVESAKGISNLSAPSKRSVASPKSQAKKSVMPMASPDHLIAKAMKLLREGKPEQVLAVLAEYPVQDSMSADVDMVKSLRANATTLIAARHK